MKSKKFNEVKPYSYWIQNISTGIKYVGLRYRNIRKNISPIDDFGIHYFTSGKLKKEFKQNPKNFKTKLLYTYDSIDEASKHEKELTKKIFKNNRYANLASFPQVEATEEVRKKISLSRIGKATIPKGTPKSEEHKLKISISNKGKASHRKGGKLSSEHSKKISKSLRGRKKGPITEEHRANISKSTKGIKKKPFSEEHRKKLALAKTGKKRPPEVIKKMLETRWGSNKKLSNLSK
jgi:hypothetical protein